MPIRFRCAYCNQLMGISKRKMGTVVRCPKCAGEIIVPSPDAEAPEDAPEQQSPMAFEDPKFEQSFPTEGVEPAVSTAPVATAPDAAPEALVSAEVMPAPSRGLGLFIPLPLLLVSVGVVLLLLILVFVLGLIIGRHSVVTGEPKNAAASVITRLAGNVPRGT